MVQATLELALKMGKVIIVTNAMEPWVERSCMNFLPQIFDLVQQIPVIYARSMYDSLTIDQATTGQALPGTSLAKPLYIQALTMTHLTSAF